VVVVLVEVDQGGERRGMRTHCRHCAHSPARPQAGSISTAAAVQQQQRSQQQEAGREGSGLVKQLAARLPCGALSLVRVLCPCDATKKSLWTCRTSD
jgi:hypothetical protein